MILVTGGSGLLGKALIKALLAKGERVKAIRNRTPLTGFSHEPNLQEVQLDLLDVIGLEEALQDVEQVYHCAGLVSFAPGEEQRLYKINVEATANLVNAALNTTVKKIVHVSSVAALGRIREDEPVNETMQWTPETSNSKYGHSKYLGEMEIWRGISEGLEAVIVNPVIILGDGDWNEGSTKIFKSAFDEFPYYTEGVTGFVDAKDVAAAMIQLMESDISGERFILSAENVSYHSVFDRIAKAFHKKAPAKKVTPFLASIVWRLEAFKSFFTGKQPLVTKETTLTAMAKVYYDNSKLLKFLPGFTYTPLSETIETTSAALQQKINSR